MKGDFRNDSEKFLNELKRCVEKVHELSDFTNSIDKLLDILQKPLTVMIMGEFSTGKSSLINALFGQNVTVVNALPTTAMITKFCYGKDSMIVHLRDGSCHEADISYFKQLTSETGKNFKAIRDKIDFIERKVSDNFLKQIEIVDSPGLNSLEREHEKITNNFISAADIIVWMFDAEKPVSKSEIDSFKKILPNLKLNPVVVVNKMDTIDTDEGDNPNDILEETRKKLKNHGIKFRNVIGVSAELAFKGRLENNKNLIVESNIREFYNIMNEIVQIDFDTHRKILFLNESAAFAFDFGSLLMSKSQDNAVYRTTDYSLYIQNSKVLADTEDVFNYTINYIAGYLDAHKMDFELRVVAKTFSGVFDWFLNKDEDYTPNDLEDAAIRDNKTAQKILVKIFKHLGDEEKANYWSHELNLVNNEKVSNVKFTGSSSLTLYEVAKKYSEKVFKVIQQYKNLLKYTTGKIFVDYKDEKSFELRFEFYFQNIQNRKLTKVKSNESVKKSKNILSDSEWDELKKLQAVLFDFRYPDEENSNSDLKISRFRTETSNEKTSIADNGHDAYMKGCEFENAKDYDSAFRWYIKAAESGNKIAMLSLGNLYMEGRGVKKDYISAMEWYQKSVAAGCEYGKSKIAELIKQTGNEITQDYAQVLQWYKKAAEAGYEQAKEKLREKLTDK